jgi:oligopeptide/dipeptide ABC transporter ATP-binding protein
MTADAAATPVLEIRDLVVEFETPRGPVRVLDGVSLDVRAGEVLCVVGESGSGKSVLNLAVMGLLPPSARVTRGSIRFDGEDLLAASEARLRSLRGRELAIVFQDPMTALNPVRRVGAQIGDVLRLHDPHQSRAARRERVVELLGHVGVPDAEARARAYPHEFSGGMRQRATIAMAMANRPRLLIADEPTTALDVTIQAQVMEVLAGVRAEVGSSMVLVTHDLGLVAEVADRVAVMYSGRIVEIGDVDEIFHLATHPYTIGLLRSLLHADATSSRAYAIPGQPPAPAERPSGCAFRNRCAVGAGLRRCAEEVPALIPVDGTLGHTAACIFGDDARPMMAEAVRLEVQP